MIMMMLTMTILWLQSFSDELRTNLHKYPFYFYGLVVENIAHTNTRYRNGVCWWSSSSSSSSINDNRNGDNRQRIVASEVKLHAYTTHQFNKFQLSYKIIYIIFSFFSVFFFSSSLSLSLSFFSALFSQLLILPRYYWMYKKIEMNTGKKWTKMTTKKPNRRTEFKSKVWPITRSS